MFGNTFVGGGGGGGGGFTVLTKSLLTSKANNTFILEPEFNFNISLEINQSLTGKVVLFWLASSTVPDGKFIFALTPATGLTMLGQTPTASSAVAVGASPTAMINFLATVTFGSANVSFVTEYNFIINNFSIATRVSNVTFSWAQNTTTAGNPLFLCAGSYLQYKRLTL